MFFIFNGYTSTINEINKKTREATNILLDATKASGSFNLSLDVTAANAFMAAGALNYLNSELQSTDNKAYVASESMDKLNFTLNAADEKAFVAGSSIDFFASTLKAIRKGASKANISLNKVESSLKDISSNADKVSGTAVDLTEKLDALGTGANQANTGTENFSSKLNKADASAKSAGSSIGNLVGKFINLENIQKGMAIVDDYTNTSTRLGLITDNLQEQKDLQDKIFAAAYRSKSAYSDMADAITNMGLTAKDAFSSNDEIGAFTELIQKSSKLGGGSASDQSDVMSQVKEAMGSGKLEEDGFNSILTNAPMIADAISKYTGVSKENLSKMASEGGITAEILKNSMFMASDGINEEFNNLPTTFADLWTQIQTGALQAFGPILEIVSGFLNSDMFLNTISLIMAGISLLTSAIGWVIGLIVDNWPLIQSILLAIGGYLSATLIPSLIKTGIEGFLSGVKTAVSWLAVNAPLIFIIGIIALIIYAIIEAGTTIEDVVGVIGGVIGVAIAGVWNLFLGLLDFVLGIISILINPFVDFANFLGNIFTNPVSSIIYLFQGLADTALAALEKIASGMDFVFGTNMADTVAGWRTDLKVMADEAVAKMSPNDDYTNYFDKFDLSVEDFGLERMDYTKSFDTGKKIGSSIANNVSGAIGSKLDGLTGDFGKAEWEGSFGDSLGMKDLGTTANPVNIEGSGSGGAVEVDMPEEDLQYLRDLAERDFINNFSTATLAPNIQVSFGDVHETADTDQVLGRIKEILQEEIATTAEGVYH